MYREINKVKLTITLDRIIHVECLPSTTMTLEDGRESTRVVAEMINSQPLPMLCDLTNVVKMTRECRQHFAGAEHASVFTKCALIVTSPIAKMIGNFFLGANRPLRPTSLFTSKGEAFEWLRK